MGLEQDGDPLADYAAWADAEIPDDPGAPEPSPERPEGIVPLGFDRRKYFYYSRGAGQVVSLRAGEHTEMHLLGLASRPHYWERSQWCGQKGIIAWTDAADHMMTQCRRMGVFDPAILRGRGAWLDGGRSVLHVGDALIVDGVRSPLVIDGSPWIYETGVRLGDFREPPLATREAHRLLQLCQRLSWDRGISATLTAGFLVVAPLCGALHWRPSCWMTGASESGKTWINEHIIRPMLGGVALIVQGQTTEAGLRQALGSDALPVLFDEAEAEERGAEARAAAILGLLRQSSSDAAGAIIKGTQSQDGALRFRIRSSFWFSSINVSIVHRADESRITVLGVGGGQRLTQAEFLALERDTAALITPAYASGLVARSVRLLPAIRANATTFRDALAEHLGTTRAGDQLGTLLAGAYSLHSVGLIAPDAALAYVRKQEWDSVAVTKADAETDERRLLIRITQHRHRINGGQEPTVERLISAAWGLEGEWLDQNSAERELRSTGLRTDAGGIWVSNSHPALARMLAETPWASSWRRALLRLPGAEASPRPIRFGLMAPTQAVFVPRTTLEMAG